MTGPPTLRSIRQPRSPLRPLTSRALLGMIIGGALIASCAPARYRPGPEEGPTCPTGQRSCDDGCLAVEQPCRGDCSPGHMCGAVCVAPDACCTGGSPGCGASERCDGAGACLSRFAEFAVPGSNITGIAVGPDGYVWFTNQKSARIGKISPLGAVTTFDVFGRPQAMARSDGSLWFTLVDSNRVGRLTSTGNRLTDVQLGGSIGAGGIASGPGGRVWVAEYGGNRIARMTTAGELAEFALPSENAAPFGIAVGPDGNMWFAEAGAHKIGRITPEGDIREFAITPDSRPTHLVAGPDGHIWFTTYRGNRIGRMTTDGELLGEYAPLTANSGLSGITVGPDGNLWWAAVGSFRIGRISPQGVVAEFMLPPENSSPYQILTAPDGNLWFSQANFVGKLGRFTPQ